MRCGPALLRDGLAGEVDDAVGLLESCGELGGLPAAGLGRIQLQPVDPAILSFDLWAMLAATLLLAPFVFTKIQMGKRVGIGLTALYAAYLIVLVT